MHYFDDLNVKMVNYCKDQSCKQLISLNCVSRCFNGINTILDWRT